VGPETHVHKITNVPVFYMALGLYDFGAGKSITGWALKSQLFWAQMALSSLVATMAQKSLELRNIPLKGPL
jgi:hypothetical protein